MKTDLIEPYSDYISRKAILHKKNSLISWHYDHTKNRSVKGINLLNYLYHTGEASILVAYKLIEKTIEYTDPKTDKKKRRNGFTKNEYFRELIGVCCQNNISFRYVLAYSWFCAKDNMKFICHDCQKHFIMAIKSNRLVFLSEQDKRNGRSQHVEDMDFPEDKPVKVWVTGVDFPILLFRQVFKNKDGSMGILYLVCSDLGCDGDTITTIYKKRWKVEVFHKTLKSNAAMAKSPAHTVRTQSNHLLFGLPTIDIVSSPQNEPFSTEG